MLLTEKLKEKLKLRLDGAENTDDDSLKAIIGELVEEEYRGKPLLLKERVRISRELFNSVRGLDVLEEILADKTVTEIMINGPDNIFIEKQGRLYRYDGGFASREKLLDIIQNIVGRANRRVNEASPIADTRLPDGSRVNVVLNPIAVNGPAVTIRKFPEEPMTMEDLLAIGSITGEAADFLKEAVEKRLNILISGGTGSGKTTFLNVLSGFIPKDERIVTIEDSAELRISGVENLVSLECRQANVEGENEISIRDLIKASLRMRPSRVIVGEVRGPEAIDMLQAMNTGHDGSLSTGHANSPADMLTRLETMVIMGMDMPLSAVKGQIASAIDLLIHLGRQRDGKRRVMEITEITGIRGNKIQLNPLFRMDSQDRELLKASDLKSHTF